MIITLTVLAVMALVSMYYVHLIDKYGKIVDDSAIHRMLQIESREYKDYTGERKVFYYMGCTIRSRPYPNGNIYKLNCFMFPYAIDGMGPIPFWYKSLEIIKYL
jgi:hypothetical protein